MKILNKILMLACLGSASFVYGADNVEDNLVANQNVIQNVRPITLPSTVKSVTYDAETQQFSGNIMHMAGVIGGEFGAKTLGTKQKYEASLNEIEATLNTLKSNQSDDNADQIVIQEGLQAHYSLKLKKLDDELKFFSSLPETLNNLFYTLMVFPHNVYVSETHNISEYGAGESSPYMGMNPVQGNWPENAKAIDLEELAKDFGTLASILGNYSRRALNAESDIAREANDYSKNTKALNSKAVQEALTFLSAEVSEGLQKGISSFLTHATAKEIRKIKERNENLWQPMHDFHKNLAEVVKEFQAPQR